MTPRTLIFTGDGKGKTTAALGMAFRAAGHGLRVLFLQFVKSDDSTGEAVALKSCPAILWKLAGKGFVPPENHPSFSEHRQAAENAFSFASDSARSGNFELIILDEILVALKKKLLPENAIASLLQTPDRRCHIVLTGRGATPSLIALADTVTEMLCTKHAYNEGLSAEKGVEF